nr:AAA family ATPase [Methylorubrum zatmanii]
MAVGLIPFAANAVTKRPIAKGWQSLDVGTAREQFRGAPNAMLGLNCERHGWVVVDCDNKNGKLGSAVFRELCRQHSISLAEVPCVRTPSGGEHFFFGAVAGVPVKSTTDKLGLGIDTRAVGGLVIAAGSVRRDGGEYQPVFPADLKAFIARIADAARLSPFPAGLAELVGLARPRAARATRADDRPPFQPWVWPDGYITPHMAAEFAARLPEPCEFSAGIIEWAGELLAAATEAGLALARAGKLKDYGPWRDLVLFAFTAFAFDWPDLEAEAKAAYDAVCAASVGANTADDEDHWHKTLAAARGPDQPRFTVECTIGKAIEAGVWSPSPARPQTVAQSSGGASPLPPMTTTPSGLAQGVASVSNDNAPPIAAPAQAQAAPPIAHPVSGFGGIAVPAPRSRSLDLTVVPPHRRWVLGHRLLRGEITILAAPGGRGKSAVAVAWACSLAVGRRLVGEYVHGTPKRVLYISTEDSTEELNRRFYAAAKAHELTAADLAGVQVLGVDIARLALTATGERGTPTMSLAGMQELRGLLADAEADVVILDPLGPLIPAGLNDNGLVASLMAQLKALSVQGDFALLILHHFKKGSDGSAEAVGGASAIVNFARAAFSVGAMSDREAGAFGILPSERWRHLRVTDLKVNLAPPVDAADWLTLSSVTLPNAEPPTYPHGESVQAVVPFVPPPTGSAAAATLDAAQRSAVENAFTRRVREAHEAGRALYCTRQGAAAAGMPTPCDVLAEVLGGATGRPLEDCKRLAEPILADLMARAVVVEAQITTANRHKRRGLILGSGVLIGG